MLKDVVYFSYGYMIITFIIIHTLTFIIIVVTIIITFITLDVIADVIIILLFPKHVLNSTGERTVLTQHSSCLMFRSGMNFLDYYSGT